MAYAYVQGAVGTVNQSGTTATVSLTGVGAGNLLVIGVRMSSENRDVASIAGGGTWVESTPDRAVANGASIRLWHCLSATGGDTTATITFDGGASVVAPLMAEYSGIGGYVGGNQAGTNGGSTVASLASGNVTPSAGGAYLVVGFGFVEPASRPLGTPAGGFTSRLYATDVTTEFRLVDVRLTSDVATGVTFAVSGGNAYMSSMVAIFEETSGADTLTIDDQPTTGTSGVALDDFDLSSSDGASTATITATIKTGSGALSGTDEVGMTAGAATFSNLIITGSGAHTLAFNAPGHDEVVSATITISGGSGPSVGAVAQYRRNQLLTE